MALYKFRIIIIIIIIIVTNTQKVILQAYNECSA